MIRKREELKRISEAYQEIVEKELTPYQKISDQIKGISYVRSKIHAKKKKSEADMMKMKKLTADILKLRDKQKKLMKR